MVIGCSPGCSGGVRKVPSGLIDPPAPCGQGNQHHVEARRREGYELYRGKWRTPQEIEIDRHFSNIEDLMTEFKPTRGGDQSRVLFRPSDWPIS